MKGSQQKGQFVIVSDKYSGFLRKSLKVFICPKKVLIRAESLIKFIKSSHYVACIAKNLHHLLQWWV